VFLVMAARSAAAWEFSDGFESGVPGRLPNAPWQTTGFFWTVGRGALHADGAGDSAAWVNGPVGIAGRLEARLTVRRVRGDDWKTAGLMLRLDADRFWRLSLVESPGPATAKPRRFIELREMFDGVWGAESEPGTRLESAGWTGDVGWKEGVRYRLSIEFSRSGIAGRVLSPAGGRIWQASFGFPPIGATSFVASGRLAVSAGGLEAEFDDAGARLKSAPGEAQEAPAPVPPAYDLAPMGGAAGKATGFFRAEEHGGKWWCVDPNGRLFLALGVDHVNYQVHWAEKLGYAPYHRNVEAKYGSEDSWAKETLRRLRSWGFNLLAAGHGERLRHRGFPFTEFITFGAEFSEVSDIAPKTTWTGFPNVFHPRWEEFCRWKARNMCAPLREDPWLFGYFLDNELEWYGKDDSEVGLVHETIGKPAAHDAKIAWVDLVRRMHGSIDAVNTAWGTRYRSFAGLAADTRRPPLETDAFLADERAFLVEIAERYFAPATRAIRDADPNHLVIGCRFAGRAPEPVWPVAGRHLDVMSVNYYPRADLEAGTVDEFVAEASRVAAIHRRPMMVTEWSFPALDSGLPCLHGAGMRVDTQDQRARAWEIMQSAILSSTFMVGSDYFMWADEPAEGISSTFPEDSNYGLVDLRDEPYEPLVRTAARVNPAAMSLHGAGPGTSLARSRPAELPPGYRSLLLLRSAAPPTQSSSTAFTIASGPLRLVKDGPGGDLVDRIMLGPIELGRVQAMVHQNAGQDLWQTASRLVSALRRDERAGTILDLTAEFAPGSAADARTEIDAAGRPAPRRAHPHAFRMTFRFEIPADGGFFTVRCLEVTNTDPEPWRLVDWFCYLPSAIGGSEAGDEVPGRGVPNYYGLQTVWTDTGSGAAFGAVVFEPVRGWFWRDERGAEHPDIYRRADVVLQSGETWRAPNGDPEVHVFGLRADAASRPWNDFVRQASAFRRAIVSGQR